jgi:hypothetical protein
MRAGILGRIRVGFIQNSSKTTILANVHNAFLSRETVRQRCDDHPKSIDYSGMNSGSV